jgi:hypothetical protein
MRTLCWLALTAASATPGWSQAQIGGPTLGLLYDNCNRSLRPITGVPGAAYLGAPLLDNLDGAAVGPSGQSALVLRGQAVYLIDPAASPDALPVAATLPSADRLSWNQPGSALLYSSLTRQFQRIDFSSSGAAARDPLNLAIPGDVAVFGLAPESGSIVAGITGTEQNGVYLLSPDAAPLRILDVRHSAALLFDGNGRDLFVTDADGGRVFQIRNFAALPEPVQLFDAQAGIGNPVALAILPTAGQILIADAQSPAVDVVDVNGRAFLRQLPLDFRPASLNPILPGKVFLLNQNAACGEAYQFLELSRMSVYFVPAGGVQP